MQTLPRKRSVEHAEGPIADPPVYIPKSCSDVT